MLVVGGVVLGGVGVIPRMNVAMACACLERCGIGPWSMRRSKPRRNDSQRQNQRQRRNQGDYALPSIPFCPVLSHALPVVGVALSPWGGYAPFMPDVHRHASHPAIVTRLKRAEGHLRHVIAMIESGSPCPDIATQLLAVERAVGEAKRTLIHDHIDHCLGTGTQDLAEIKAMTKLL